MSPQEGGGVAVGGFGVAVGVNLPVGVLVGLRVGVLVGLRVGVAVGGFGVAVGGFGVGVTQPEQIPVVQLPLQHVCQVLTI